MRPKNLNTGLRGGLFEAKHGAQMGPAVWLYGWLVMRQTTEHGSTGLVLGGRPITYREIEQETGFNRRTLERWMRRLRRGGYIETVVPMAAGAGVGLVIRILRQRNSVPASGGFRLPSPQGCRDRVYAILRGALRNPARPYRCKWRNIQHFRPE